MNQLVMGTMLLTWCAGILAGCATTDKKASLAPKAVATSTQSREVVYLMMSGNKWSPPGEPTASIRTQRSSRLKPLPDTEIAASQKISLVKVNTDTGELAGTAVLPVDAGDLMLRSLRRELKAKGYTVISVRQLPGKTEHGIDISWVSTDMEQNSGLLTLAGQCELRIRLDLWRNGNKTVSRDYAAVVSDYSITEQNKLLARLLEKATQEITVQAVPDIMDQMPGFRK